MIEDIIKCQRTCGNCYQFTVLIPSWNNLGFLRTCIGSVRRNSYYDLQIIVIINGGSDGSFEWVETQNDIDFVHSPENMGVCYGLNIARSLIKSDYIIYLNDDMYVLPGWDRELYREIENIGRKEFLLSGTMIEPFYNGKPCIVVRDYGFSFKDFNEIALLNDFKGLVIADWYGCESSPLVVHIDTWDLVGGMSIEFSPGINSYSDFARKLYHAGIRIFKGKGNCLVYHFGSKSTNRVKQNDGMKTFLLKWGITSGTFHRDYLRRGTIFSGEVSEVTSSKIRSFIHRLRRIKNS
jgi:glycosyltransferase involved in cell wall biosynthesis